MIREVKLNKENHIIKITQDSDPESPDAWGVEDMFLVYDHSQFTVTREGFEPSSIYKYLQLCSYPETIDLRDDDFDKYWIFPVYAYIHSGVSLSLTHQGCKWDVSSTGFILVEKPVFITEPEATYYAKGLIDAWNQYLSGNVYRFEIIEKKMCNHCGTIEELEHDSLSGFYGELNDELIDDMLSYTKYKLSKVITKENV